MAPTPPPVPGPGLRAWLAAALAVLVLPAIDLAVLVVARGRILEDRFFGQALEPALAGCAAPVRPLTCNPLEATQTATTLSIWLIVAGAAGLAALWLAWLAVRRGRGLGTLVRAGVPIAVLGAVAVLAVAVGLAVTAAIAIQEAFVRRVFAIAVVAVAVVGGLAVVEAAAWSLGLFRRHHRAVRGRLVAPTDEPELFDRVRGITRRLGVEPPFRIVLAAGGAPGLSDEPVHLGPIETSGRVLVVPIAGIGRGGDGAATVARGLGLAVPPADALALRVAPRVEALRANHARLAAEAEGWQALLVAPVEPVVGLAIAIVGAGWSVVAPALERASEGAAARVTGGAEAPPDPASWLLDDAAAAAEVSRAVEAIDAHEAAAAHHRNPRRLDRVGAVLVLAFTVLLGLAGWSAVAGGPGEALLPAAGALGVAAALAWWWSRQWTIQTAADGTIEATSWLPGRPGGAVRRFDGAETTATVGGARSIELASGPEAVTVLATTWPAIRFRELVHDLRRAGVEVRFAPAAADLDDRVVVLAWAATGAAAGAWRLAGTARSGDGDFVPVPPLEEVAGRPGGLEAAIEARRRGAPGRVGRRGAQDAAELLHAAGLDPAAWTGIGLAFDTTFGWRAWRDGEPGAWRLEGEPEPGDLAGLLVAAASGGGLRGEGGAGEAGGA